MPIKSKKTGKSGSRPTTELKKTINEDEFFKIYNNLVKFYDNPKNLSEKIGSFDNNYKKILEERMKICGKNVDLEVYSDVNQHTIIDIRTKKNLIDAINKNGDCLL